MKKTVLISAAFFVLLSTLTSCKKDYQCKCAITDYNGYVGYYSTTTHATKKNALKECKDSAPDAPYGITCTVE